LKKKPFGTKTPWEMIYKSFFSAKRNEETGIEVSEEIQSISSQSNNFSEEPTEEFVAPTTVQSLITQRRETFEEEEESSIFASPELITNYSSPLNYMPELPPSVIRSFTPTPVNSMKRKPLTPRAKHFDFESPERIIIEKPIATKIDFSPEETEPENNHLIENLPSLTPPVLENICSQSEK
jgi:hypothetical protein